MDYLGLKYILGAELGEGLVDFQFSNMQMIRKLDPWHPGFTHWSIDHIFGNNWSSINTYSQSTPLMQIMCNQSGTVSLWTKT